jgi:hypothetical protein
MSQEKSERPQQQKPQQGPEADPGDERVVMIHGFSREETVMVMRAVKSAVQDPAGVAFTTTTPTNMEWRVKELIGEVREEHEYMRNNPPGGRSGGQSAGTGGGQSGGQSGGNESGGGKTGGTKG